MKINLCKKYKEKWLSDGKEKKLSSLINYMLRATKCEQMEIVYYIKNYFLEDDYEGCLKLFNSNNDDQILCRIRDEYDQLFISLKEQVRILLQNWIKENEQFIKHDAEITDSRKAQLFNVFKTKRRGYEFFRQWKKLAEEIEKKYNDKKITYINSRIDVLWNFFEEYLLNKHLILTGDIFTNNKKKEIIKFITNRFEAYYQTKISIRKIRHSFTKYLNDAKKEKRNILGKQLYYISKPHPNDKKSGPTRYWFCDENQDCSKRKLFKLINYNLSINLEPRKYGTKSKYLIFAYCFWEAAQEKIGRTIIAEVTVEDVANLYQIYYKVIEDEKIMKAFEQEFNDNLQQISMTIKSDNEPEKEFTAKEQLENPQLRENISHIIDTLVEKATKIDRETYIMLMYLYFGAFFQGKTINEKQIMNLLKLKSNNYIKKFKESLKKFLSSESEHFDLPILLKIFYDEVKNEFLRLPNNREGLDLIEEYIKKLK